jgi:hypothetical protein
MKPFQSLIEAALLYPMSRVITGTVLFIVATVLLGTASAMAQNTCQKAKADKLAVCLKQAFDDVQTCQGNCEDDPDDRGAYNQCRRVCSGEEQKDRAECFAEDKKVICP